MMKRILLLISLALIATSCASQVPIAVNHPISTQKKARAVHHWDVLADDVTTQTLIALRKAGLAEETPLFVSLPSDNSAFGKAFRTLLITRMVGRGLPVTSKNDPKAIELQYETQLVRHNSSRYAHVPGTFTSLASGIWVLRDLIVGSSAAMPAGLAVSALADYGAGQYAGGATPTELLVTSSIELDKKYVMRKSDIYYIEDADTNLFDPCSPEDKCCESPDKCAKKAAPNRGVKELLTTTCDRIPCQPNQK